MSRRLRGWARRAARLADSSGQAAVELIGYTLLVVMFALMIVQGVCLTQSIGVAQQAARDGARAASTGGSATAAVAAQVPGWASVQHVSTSSAGQSVKVTVTVKVPFLVHGASVGGWTVTRSAVMPRL